MKLFNTVATFLSLALALAFTASAHVSMTQSSPENEAMLMQSPEELVLTFSGEVRLAKVLLTDSGNKTVDFNFKPSAQASKQFNYKLPTLSEGQYTVKWMVLGGDGHKMTGTFTFMIGGHGMHQDMKKAMPASHSHNH